MKSKSKKDEGRKKNTRQTSNLNDFGLEPPKIYRDSQREGRADFVKTKRNSNENLTRTEKRSRQTKKRKKRNALRKVLIWLVAIVSFIAVGVVLSLTVFFNITQITVSGDSVYETEQVLSQCSIHTGENLFLADTKNAKQMLEQNLPYIYNAQITRKLPSVIDINITKAQVAYSVKNKDKTYILLDDNFKVLELQAKKSKAIIISNSDIKTQSIGAKIEFKDRHIDNCLNELAQCIKDNSFDKITSIYSKNLTDNYVVYDKRIKFKLGSTDNLESKIYKGLAACQKLDVTNPNAKGTMTITDDKAIYFTEE